MARPLRIEFEGAFYHVTARGNERGNIYYANADYEKFKDYLKDGQEKYGYRLHCYVLMTNHYHLLIETPDGKVIKKIAFGMFSKHEESLARHVSFLKNPNSEKALPC